MVRQRFRKLQPPKDAPELPNIQEPQKGLVPIFNSPFYATPSTPADPRDCDRYPDSPYCGGFPFTNKPVSIEPSIIKDECNLGVQLDGSFAFVKVPPIQLVYRSPNCDPGEPPPPPERKKDPHNDPVPIPPSPCGGNLYVIYWAFARDYLDGQLPQWGGLPQGQYEEIRTLSIDELQCPFLGNYSIDNYPWQKADVYIRTTYKSTITFNGIHARNFISRVDREQETIDDWLAQGNTISGDPYTVGATWTQKVTKVTGIYLYSPNPQVRDEFDETNGANRRLEVNQYDLVFVALSDEEKANADLRNTFQVTRSTTFFDFLYDPSDFPINVPSKYEPRTVDVFPLDPDFYGQPYGYKWYEIHAKEDQPHIVPICPYSPPPPPKPCMCCCPNTDYNDQLLRLILKKIGSEHLPASVPKLLTDNSKGSVQVASLAEFTAYMVKQLDAVCGRYPIEIKIEDDDLTKEGNQEKKVKLPNIAETLAEIMGLLMVIRSESDATLNLAIRTLVETGSGKQTAFLAYEYAKANAEFLGYKGEQVERKVPFSFKPGESRLDKMLVETEVKVKGWDNSDTSDLNDHLAPLLELAAMWKVANFRKTGSENIPGALLKILKGAAKLSDDVDTGLLLDKVKKHNEKENPDPKDLLDQWDQFTEKAEQGFIHQEGITDHEHPYGRPLEQRPKIRDISKDTSNS